MILHLLCVLFFNSSVINALLRIYYVLVLPEYIELKCI